MCYLCYGFPLNYNFKLNFKTFHIILNNNSICEIVDFKDKHYFSKNIPNIGPGTPSTISGTISNLNTFEKPLPVGPAPSFLQGSMETSICKDRSSLGTENVRSTHHGFLRKAAPSCSRWKSQLGRQSALLMGSHHEDWSGLEPRRGYYAILPSSVQNARNEEKGRKKMLFLDKIMGYITEIQSNLAGNQMLNGQHRNNLGVHQRGID